MARTIASAVLVVALASPATATARTRWTTGPSLGDGLIVELSCPSNHLCVALGKGDRTQRYGRLVRFDPTARQVARPIRVTGFRPTDVSCPSVRECAVVGLGPQLQTGGDVRFPLEEATIDPLRGTSGATHTLDVNLNDPLEGVDVRCLSVNKCVEIEWTYNLPVRAQVFDPTTGAAGPRLIADNTDTGYSGNSPAGFACPSPDRCVVIDGFGGETTFDPGSSRPRTKRSQLRAAFSGLSCPSAGICLTLGPLGDVYTLPPAQPHRFRDYSLNRGALSAVFCPNTRECLLGGTNGLVLTADLRAPTRFTAVRLAHAGWIEQLDCPSGSECVAATADGRAIVRRS